MTGTAAQISALSAVAPRAGWERPRKPQRAELSQPGMVPRAQLLSPSPVERASGRRRAISVNDSQETVLTDMVDGISMRVATRARPTDPESIGWTKTARCAPKDSGGATLVTPRQGVVVAEKEPASEKTELRIIDALEADEDGGEKPSAQGGCRRRTPTVLATPDGPCKPCASNPTFQTVRHADVASLIGGPGAHRPVAGSLGSGDPGQHEANRPNNAPTLHRHQTFRGTVGGTTVTPTSASTTGSSVQRGHTRLASRRCASPARPRSAARAARADLSCG